MNAWLFAAFTRALFSHRRAINSEGRGVQSVYGVDAPCLGAIAAIRASTADAMGGEKLDARKVWTAIQAADGSVRLAANALHVGVRDVLAILADDPNAVLTARRASVPKTDSGPLPVFRLWLDDDEEEGGATRQP